MSRYTKQDPKCEGMIMCYKENTFTKSQFIELIEKNFPDDFGNIAVVTTVEDGAEVLQNIMFGKILDV